MSSRRIDIRTSRKAKPINEKVSVESLPVTKNRKNARKSPISVKRKIKKTADKKDSSPQTIQNPPVLENLSTHWDSDDEKPRRRRVDATDYIRRRFLYDTDSHKCNQKVKPKKPHRSFISCDMGFRNSTAALMAASSANLQKKQKKPKKSNLSSDMKRFSNQWVRKIKKQDNVFQDHQLVHIDNLSSAEERGSSTDEQTFSDEEVSHPIVSFPDRHIPIKRDGKSEHLIKPIVQKMPKRDPLRTNRIFSHSISQNPSEYISELPEFFLNDHMADFTRSRGPVVLSKRARHRNIPVQSTSKPNFVKSMAEYTSREFNEFGLSDSDDTFRQPGRINFCLDQDVPITPSNRTVEGNWDGHLSGARVSVPPESLRPQADVDVNDFAGDLLPQIPKHVQSAPTSGKGRRKSPLRPMQVLRSEPFVFNADNGGITSTSTAGASLIKMKQLTPSTFGQAVDSVESISSSSAGLVDLCAAAVLDSSASNELRPPVNNGNGAELRGLSTTSTHPQQYSLVKSNIISLQHYGQMFVDTGVRPPVGGYTVAPGTHISSLSLPQGRYVYGSSQNGRSPQANNVGKPAPSSKGSGSSSSSSVIRRRPTILKRLVPPPMASFNQCHKVSPDNHASVRTIPSFSPSSTPPFMRAALRGVPVSPLPTGGHKLQHGLTYTIVPATMDGQQGVMTVAPPGNLCTPSRQTASSRLFGSRRNATGTTNASEPKLKTPSNTNSALTIIPYLPASSNISTNQQSVRYALVRGDSEGKKYVLLASGADYKKELESIETTKQDGMQTNEPCLEENTLTAATAANTSAYYARPITAAVDLIPSNQNLPPEHTAALAS